MQKIINDKKQVSEILTDAYFLIPPDIVGFGNLYIIRFDSRKDTTTREEIRFLNNFSDMLDSKIRLTAR